ncbi:hypothetical protein [Nocardia nova]|uniref:hypothetical protein n=1 Tax=Nocardia nova TaxID=37330 RepID=UPI001895745E|nr:hypothetical protein [Nocardia nova]MBF6145981.1 hypothetical protein [Nocardia nova]
MSWFTKYRCDAGHCDWEWLHAYRHPPGRNSRWFAASEHHIDSGGRVELFRVVRIGGSDIAVSEHSWSGRVRAVNFPHIFVPADGRLAELLCNVELLGPLSVGRARQLIDIHGDHDCLVVHAARALEDKDDET